MEHFHNARRALMAPHREGEVQAFVHAFEACHRALTPSFDDSRVENEPARDALVTVRQFTERGSGLLADTARALSPAEREDFSEAVDTLASYFDRAVFCD
jgi:hypothetical protein